MHVYTALQITKVSDLWQPLLQFALTSVHLVPYVSFHSPHDQYAETLFILLDCFGSAASLTRVKYTPTSPRALTGLSPQRTLALSPVLQSGQLMKDLQGRGCSPKTGLGIMKVYLCSAVDDEKAHPRVAI